MLTKRQEYGKIEILADGIIQLRVDTIIEEDGKELSRTYHRSTLAPGADISGIQSELITAITSVIWTREAIDAYKKKQAGAQLPGVIK